MAIQGGTVAYFWDSRGRPRFGLPWARAGAGAVDRPWAQKRTRGVLGGIWRELQGWGQAPQFGTRPCSALGGLRGYLLPQVRKVPRTFSGDCARPDKRARGSVGETCGRPERDGYQRFASSRARDAQHTKHGRIRVLQDHLRTCEHMKRERRYILFSHTFFFHSRTFPLH